MPVPESGAGSSSPSRVDGDGVRITRIRPPDGIWVARLKMLALVLLTCGLAALLFLPPAPPPRVQAPITAVSEGGLPAAAPVSSNPTSPVQAEPPAAVAQATQSAAPRTDAVAPYDPNDLANHVKPGDPEPTAAELIHALRETGERGGIAAFNPPGTSPPLPGLAVPADYTLPPGFVRHHQVTDEGEPIEAILMFAPDFVLHDAEGRVIPIPEDRVVPPELAPPGLPIRQVEIPTPSN